MEPDDPKSLIGTWIVIIILIVIAVVAYLYFGGYIKFAKDAQAPVVTATNPQHVPPGDGEEFGPNKGYLVDYSPELFQKALASFVPQTKGQAETKLVLYFTQSGCGDCESTLNSLKADTIPDGVIILIVDSGKYPDVAKKYNAGLNTYVSIDINGNEITRRIGGGLYELQEMIVE